MEGVVSARGYPPTEFKDRFNNSRELLVQGCETQREIVDFRKFYGTLVVYLKKFIFDSICSHAGGPRGSDQGLRIKKGRRKRKKGGKLYCSYHKWNDNWLIL